VIFHYRYSRRQRASRNWKDKLRHRHAFDYPKEKGWSKEPLKQIWGAAAQAEADRRRKEV